MWCASRVFGWVLVALLALAASPALADELNTVHARFLDEGFMKSMGSEDATLTIESASQGKRAGLRLSNVGTLPDLVVTFDTAEQWHGLVRAWDEMSSRDNLAAGDFVEAPGAGGSSVYVGLFDMGLPEARRMDIAISDADVLFSSLFGLAPADYGAFDAALREVTAYFEK